MLENTMYLVNHLITSYLINPTMPALCWHNKPPIMPKAMPAYCACPYITGTVTLLASSALFACNIKSWERAWGRGYYSTIYVLL